MPRHLSAPLLRSVWWLSLSHGLFQEKANTLTVFLVLEPSWFHYICDDVQ